MSQNVKDTFFEYDKYDIQADQQGWLQADAQFLQQYPNIRFTIEGHCDERGSIEYHMALDKSRADAVKNALTQAGISGDRIQTVSYGKEKLFCTDNPEECWLQNRRGRFVPGEVTSSVIVAIAFTSVCGAAVFFMLTFLRALLRDARRPRTRFTGRHERTRVTPVSTAHGSPRLTVRRYFPDREPFSRLPGANVEQLSSDLMDEH